MTGASVQCETGDARRRNDPGRHSQTEQLRLSIHVAERGAALHAHSPRLSVDMDAVHRREIDHEAAVVHGIARDVVASTFDRHEQVVLTCEVHCVDDICGAAAPSDQRRSPVDQPVPDPPRFLVPEVLRCQNGSAHLQGECLQRLSVNLRDGRGRSAHDELRAKSSAVRDSNSNPTTGSSPTTQASCPGSITYAWPAEISCSVPSLWATCIAPDCSRPT